MKKKTTYFLLLALFSALYFLLINTGSTMGDYLLYSFKFSMSPQEGAPWPLIHEKVTSLGDVIYSQYVHYILLNGRSIVHTLVQILSSFINYDVCCCIATIIYIVTLILATKVFFKQNAQKWLPLFVFPIAIFAFCCEPSVIYGIVVTANYLWPLTVCLLFIIMFHRELRLVEKVLFFLVSIIAGWSHEAIAVPMSAAFIIYLFNHNKSLKPHQVIGIILLIVGTVITVCAPGNYLHFKQTQSSSNLFILIKYHLYFIVYLRLTYILAIMIVFIAIKGYLKRFTLQYKYWFIALFTSIIFIFFVGAINPRSTFFIEMISGGIICFLINDYCRPSYQKVLIVALSLIIIPLYSSAIYYRSINKNYGKQTEQIIASNENDIVNITRPTVQVPTIIAPYVTSGRNHQKEIYARWDKAVYEFAYNKKEVNIKYLE